MIELNLTFNIATCEKGGASAGTGQEGGGMGDRDWRPFVYGGLASCVAEFGNVLF